MICFKFISKNQKMSAKHIYFLANSRYFMGRIICFFKYNLFPDTACHVPYSRMVFDEVNS